MDWWLPHHLYPIKLENHACHKDSIIITISFSPCVAFALHLLFLQCCIQIVIANMAHDTLYAFALNLLFLFTFWTQKRFPISFHSIYNCPSFIASPIEVRRFLITMCICHKSFGDNDAVTQTNVIQACLNFKTMQPFTSISFKSSSALERKLSHHAG